MEETESISNVTRLAIIVAGGSGSRMKLGYPKQFMPLNGKCLLQYTIDAFLSVPNIRLVLVLPQDQIDTWKNLATDYSKYTITNGGSTRYDSVRNGLQQARGESLIAIHDGARPFITPQTIELCFAEAQTHGSAIPAIGSTDSIRLLYPDGSNHAIERNSVMRIQTPQVFKADLLKNAYNKPYSPLFTDDASVLEAAGHNIHLVQGDEDNIKVTSPADKDTALLILKRRGILK